MNVFMTYYLFVAVINKVCPMVLSTRPAIYKGEWLMINLAPLWLFLMLLFVTCFDHDYTQKFHKFY